MGFLQISTKSSNKMNDSYIFTHIHDDTYPHQLQEILSVHSQIPQCSSVSTFDAVYQMIILSQQLSLQYNCDTQLNKICEFFLTKVFYHSSLSECVYSLVGFTLSKSFLYKTQTMITALIQ